ncbi:MAG: hypothetical protein HQ456_01875 [Polynucleobacter sp.]|nr:hypothetical protein [Polynucleobacter sp.]
MNANELADALENDWADKFRFDAATMLRQQQAEIDLLTQECNALRKQLNDSQTERA